MAEYTPDEGEVRYLYVANSYSDAAYTTDKVSAEFDRFLAKVRRDAAREALDGLAADRLAAHEKAADDHKVGAMVLELHTRQETIRYRDTHYPEPFTWTEEEDARRLQSIADGAADHDPEDVTP